MVIADVSPKINQLLMPKIGITPQVQEVVLKGAYRVPLSLTSRLPVPLHFVHTAIVIRIEGKLQVSGQVPTHIIATGEQEVLV